MFYDWHKSIKFERFTDESFAEIDRRFVPVATLFAHDRVPFDKIILLDCLSGQTVLEIGCGMGYHSELFSQAGAILTSINLSETSVAATRKPLALRNIGGARYRWGHARSKSQMIPLTSYGDEECSSFGADGCNH